MLVGTSRKKKEEVHSSHKMDKTYTEAFSPCGTPRWYKFTECSKCGCAHAEHVAGFFIDTELLQECEGE